MMVTQWVVSGLPDGEKAGRRKGCLKEKGYDEVNSM